MRKFMSYTFAFIASLLLVIGVLGFIGSFSKGSGDNTVTISLSCLLSSLFVYGFSCIVDAACLYVENNDKKKQEEQ